MTAFWIGLLFTTICLCIYLYSWKSFTQEKYRLALLLLMLSGLFLRIFVSCDFFLHEWDERYHALVCKNLILHPLVPTLYDNPVLPYDYKSWISNHIWLHKPPLPLWIMALSLKIFGVSELALRIPSIILSTAGIWIMYQTAEKLVHKEVAFYSAFLFSIHGLIIELTAGRVATDHIDIFFLFFIQLAIWCSLFFEPGKKGAFFTGVLIGLAVLCKSLPALIVLPIMAMWSLHQKVRWQLMLQHQIIALGAVFILNVPWLWYTFRYFPLEAAWENKFSLLHLTTVLEGHDGNILYHLDKIRTIYGEFIYLPLIWLLYRVFTGKKRELVKIILVVWIFIPVIFFSIVKTKMPAYTLFIAPVLFIITAQFFFVLKSWENQKFPVVFKNIILIGLILLPIRYAMERIKPFENRDRFPTWVSEIRNLGQQYKGQHVVLFNSKRPIETMFYTNLIAYAHIPDSITIESLKSRGYLPIILE